LIQKFDFEPAPLALAYVLGPMFESSLRQSLILSEGSFSIFFVRPISMAFILLAISLICVQIYSTLRKKKTNYLNV